MYKLDDKKNIVKKTCVKIRKLEDDAWYIEIPESWAKELTEISDVWMIGKGLEKGLNLYSRKQWERMKILFLREKAIADNKDIKMLQRHIIASAYETRIQDGQLYVPGILIAYNQVEEEAVLIKYQKDGKFFYSVQNLREYEE